MGPQLAPTYRRTGIPVTGGSGGWISSNARSWLEVENLYLTARRLDTQLTGMTSAKPTTSAEASLIVCKRSFLFAPVGHLQDVLPFCAFREFPSLVEAEAGFQQFHINHILA
jgi:hypothetical protein